MVGGVDRQCAEWTDLLEGIGRMSIISQSDASVRFDADDPDPSDLPGTGGSFSWLRNRRTIL